MVVVVTHPSDPRPGLIVETAARVDAAAIEALKQRMLGAGCSHGLIFDDHECLVLRDTYSSLDVDSLVVDGRVATDKLLVLMPSAGRTLDQRVLDWLRSMATSWNTALPQDGAIAAPFIADIVPAVSGSFVREVA